MKITNFGPDGIPSALAGWSTGVTSINSNATTTDGGLSALNFVQRVTSNGSNILQNPSVNIAAGSGISLSAASNTVTISATGASGTFVTVTNGGGETIKAHGSMGATETIDPADGNVHTGMLDANTAITISAPSGSAAATLELWLTQDGVGGWTPTIATTGGTFTWDGTTPTLPTTALTTYRIILERVPGTTNDWIGDLVGGGGSSSPLTTKGDLYTYSTANARLAVGSNGTGLYADSSQTTGNRWTNMPIAGELLISDTPSTPLIFADLLQTETQDDLIYSDL